ncbi:MAG: hypothetical protein ACOC8F_06515 [Planctomycetota bacterium]
MPDKQRVFAVAGALAACLALVCCAVAAEPVKTVEVRETQGLDRRGEPVCIAIGDLEGPLAVRTPDGAEVSAQITGAGEDRMLWFAVSVPAGETRTYIVIPGEPGAPAHPLKVKGKALKQKVRVATAHYHAELMPKSGALHQFILPGEPSERIYNAFGPVHWNPGLVAGAKGEKPRGWMHAFQWKPAPGLSESRGPLVYEVRRKGPLPRYPEAEADIRYHFFATQPYVIMQSSVRFVKDLHVRILRNGELVFAPDLFTHVACRDRDGKLHTAEIAEAAELDFASSPDDPWLAFYNPETGLAVATIRLKVTNTGPDGGEPVLVDYRLPITRHTENPRYAFVHWARVLIWAKGKSPGEAPATKVPAGNVYFEREAWLPFRLAEDAKKRPEAMLKPVDAAAERLLHPLKVEVR